MCNCRKSFCPACNPTVSKADPPPLKVGDPVRAVIEGEVSATSGDRRVGDRWLYVKQGGQTVIVDTTAPYIVSVEVLPPPVTVFQPGQIVRSNRTPKYIYALARDGYFDVTNAGWVEYLSNPLWFTSEHYDLVDLGGDS